MRLPSSLTTPISSISIYILLVFVAMISFYLGLEYQKLSHPPDQSSSRIEAISQPSPSSPTTEMPAKNKLIEDLQKSDNINLPVIVYEPSGLFTAEEKVELKSKIVDPFFDYQNEKETQFIAMLIQKRPSEKYDLAYSAIHKNGGYSSAVIEKNRWQN